MLTQELKEHKANGIIYVLLRKETRAFGLSAQCPFILYFQATLCDYGIELRPRDTDNDTDKETYVDTSQNS